MKHYQFAIFDQKARAYLPPFILPEIEMAIRTFGDCIDSETHQFSKHPEDYTLFNLGVWNDANAVFTPVETGPQPIGNGVEFVRPHSPDLLNGEQTDASIEKISDESPVLTGASSNNSA